MILLIDNYDSFVHNLARYFELMGLATRVVRNDAVDVAELDDPSLRALVISPGPCAPDQAGNTLQLLDAVMGNSTRKLPVLGVCLGHQAIVQSLGGSIVPSGKPVHGRTSEVHHDDHHEFEGLPNPLSVARYHSLIADASTIPDSLDVSATTDGNQKTIMAVRHRELPIVGWQFHPESILTESGFALLSGFLRLANISHNHTPDFQRELSPNACANSEANNIEPDNKNDWPDGVTF